MSRPYTSSGATADSEKWDLRLQRRNRRKLSLFAGAFAICALVFISWITTSNWHHAFRDDGETAEEERALAAAALSDAPRRGGGGIIFERQPDAVDPDEARRAADVLKARRETSASAVSSDAAAAYSASSGSTAPAPASASSAAVPSSAGAKIKTRVRVHVVVEHKTHTELLVTRDPKTRAFGPCVAEAYAAFDAAPEDYKRLTEDPAVRRAAANVLLEQTGLDQPPHIEFMQGIPATGAARLGFRKRTHEEEHAERRGETVEDLAEVAYVALVRGERVSAAGGALRGSRDGHAEMRRVPLEAALRGGVSVESLPALRHDLKSLRTFLEPWLITKGADPKAACKDPRVAAARAAGDEAEAEAIYRTVPKDAES
jgi:hypothetical protein